MLSVVRRLRKPLFAIPAAIVLLLASGLTADWWYGIPDGEQSRYVGGDSCIACHQSEHAKWRNSHHDLAMQLANGETVLGDFADVEFDYRGVISKLFREDDEFFVTTDGADGELATFPIKYTFGVTPLQQYMVEFEDGRVQVLPFCWDTKAKRWFHIYEQDPHTIQPEDPTHWTNVGQNWNHTCAECHSTDLVKGYDFASDTFHTTFSDIDVNCEACHGPGSHHVEMAESWSPFWDRKRGYGLAKLKGTDTTTQITQLETCAKCHAHRDAVHPGFHAGDDFDSHYRLSLLDTGLYYHDGQILEEDYVYGSFLQSRMFRENVRCTDCHDPHTAKLKRQGNQLCAECHVPAKYDTPNHHHHASGSPGGACVECHMPERTYMVVDPRRDHSIRPPRPDLSLVLDTPNACTDCHIEQAFAADGMEGIRNNPRLGPKTIAEAPDEIPRDYAEWLSKSQDGDQTARQEIDAWNQWAADAFNNWYGEKPITEHFAITLDAGMQAKLPESLRPLNESGEVDRPAELAQIARMLTELSKNREVGPIVRASAVSLLGNFPTSRTINANAEALEDPSPLVRRAAVANLESFYPVDRISVWQRDRLPPASQQQLDAQLRALVKALVEPLSDPVRTVRNEAARVGAIIPRALLTQDSRAALDKAIDEYKTGLLSNADQAAAWTTWAGVLERQAKLEDAEDAYKNALQRLNEFIPARMALATLYNYQGRNQEAETLLREAIRVLPELPEARYSLGLLLAEDPNRLREAQQELGEAARLAPSQHRMRYNNGLALQQLGMWPEAEAELAAAANLAPGSVDYQIALMAFYESRATWHKALEVARRLKTMLPQNQEIDAKLIELQRKTANQPSGPGRE